MSLPEKRIIRIPKNKKEIIFENGILSLETLATKGKIPTSGKPGIYLLDAGNLVYPLVLRPWKSGDYFFPLGMEHRKKLSDFFVDVKVSRFEKEKCRVLVSGKDIICILGHRIDNRYKIKPNTKKILRLVYTKSLK